MCVCRILLFERGFVKIFLLIGVGLLSLGFVAVAKNKYKEGDKQGTFIAIFMVVFFLLLFAYLC